MLVTSSCKWDCDQTGYGVAAKITFADVENAAALTIATIVQQRRCIVTISAVIATLTSRTV